MFSQGIGFQSVYTTPGGGGNPTLQDVTTNGNETSNSIILVDEFGNKIRINANEDSFLVNKIVGDEETPIININSKGVTLQEALDTFQLYKENSGSALYKFPNNTVFELVASREWTTLQLANKADLVGGKIPAAQIPSGFDEILEYATFTAFPVVGQSNIYYVALDTNKTFRWAGSTYVVMNEGIALGETSSTAYRGDRGKTAYDHSQTSGNPHGTTAAQVGAYTQSQVDILLLSKQNTINYTPYNSSNIVVKSLTNTFTTTSTTSADCNLSFSIAANEVWYVEIKVNSGFGGNPGGGKYQVSAPVGCVIEGSVTTYNLSSTLNVQRISAINTLGNVVKSSTLATFLPDIIQFRIKAGATPGTVSLGVAANSAGTAFNIQAGGSMVAFKSAEV